MAIAGGFDLQRVQKIRKGALLAALALVTGLGFVTANRWGGEGFHEGVELLGRAMIVVAIVGRAWCSLYIGGRKKAEIVDRGPYSISRNPLYVFSFIGAFGMGAQTGSVTLATLFTVVAFGVFFLTLKREEAWLSEAFGETYEAYRRRTPRFGPDFSLWRDAETLEVRPRFFLTTIRDGLVFFLAIPLFEGAERLQHIGWLSTLLHLP